MTVTSKQREFVESTQANISFDHLQPVQTDYESIRLLLRCYDQYMHTIFARTKQLGTMYASAMTTEPVRSEKLTSCFDVEFCSVLEWLGAHFNSRKL